MVEAALGLAGLKTIQATLSALSLLHLTSHRFPPAASLTGNLEFDYVVIGGGTAGSIVASRLSEDPNVTVAIIEAGGDPPLESVLPGLFTLQPLASYDYNYLAQNNHYTSQNIMKHKPGMTAGMMLGGTSAMSHTFHLRGNPHEFEKWAEVAGDDSWNYDGMLPYFIKSERINDAEILNGPTADLHGTTGNIGLTRQFDNTNNDYIEAFKEIGYDYNPDVNSENNLGVSYPYHLIFDGTRQDGAESYLSPAKSRDNLYVFKHTTATKIIFDDDKNAVGVQVTAGLFKKATIKATKEVILAAGVVKSPQLLMLSGIGPASHLKTFNIPVLSDLPVGQNLRDRVGLVVPFKMQASSALTTISDPTKFPVPVTVGYKALNESQSYPDFQTLNLVFPHDSSGLLMILSNVVKYENDIVDRIYSNNKGHDLLLVTVSSGHPESTGELLLKSKDLSDTPSISLGHFSNPKDLDQMAEFLLDLSRLVNTTYFKNVGAELVDLNLKECRSIQKDTVEFWKCYAVGMSTTFWQYCGSCSMGSVVDSKLKVNGVDRLRVVDASAMPSLNSGEILAAVIAFAEKAADLIKDDFDS
ncbi:ecdysone oxidase-like [Ostrinia nubilalis]|uniref:ecdysone oxidase-like n=1 Tax=Ostrinia nubilalis TaxID=29057 RepID=UPI0030826AD4